MARARVSLRRESRHGGRGRRGGDGAKGRGVCRARGVAECACVRARRRAASTSNSAKPKRAEGRAVLATAAFGGGRNAGRAVVVEPAGECDWRKGGEPIRRRVVPVPSTPRLAARGAREPMDALVRSDTQLLGVRGATSADRHVRHGPGILGPLRPSRAPVASAAGRQLPIVPRRHDPCMGGACGRVPDGAAALALHA